MMTGLMGVITFGVIAGIGLLAYLAVEYTERKGKEKQREATESDWKKILAEYLGKSCEVTIKEPMVNIDVIYSTRGFLRDMDDEWLELEKEVRQFIEDEGLSLDDLGSFAHDAGETLTMVCNGIRYEKEKDRH